MKQKEDVEKCLRVDISVELVEEEFKRTYHEDLLDACLVHNTNTYDGNVEVAACA